MNLLAVWECDFEASIDAVHTWKCLDHSAELPLQRWHVVVLNNHQVTDAQLGRRRRLAVMRGAHEKGNTWQSKGARRRKKRHHELCALFLHQQGQQSLVGSGQKARKATLTDKQVSTQVTATIKEVEKSAMSWFRYAAERAAALQKEAETCSVVTDLLRDSEPV
ncbi:hypothetical protein MTO96_029987 [Rhipicephalus appendiculatus]